MKIFCSENFQKLVNRFHYISQGYSIMNRLPRNRRLHDSTG